MKPIGYVSIALMLLSTATPGQAQGPQIGAGDTAATDVDASVVLVIGETVEGDGTPVPSTLVRIRSLDSGRIVADAISDADGQFAVSVPASRSYIVEVTDDRGRLLTVSDPFSPEPGRATLTTLVVKANNQPPLGLFGTTAGAILAAAAGAGVTALVPGGPPASPER